MSVILSSHLVADLERVCEYLVVLVGSHLQVTGEIEDLLATRHRLSAPRLAARRLPGDWDVIEEHATDRQQTVIVRHEGAVLDPAFTVESLDLEDLVLAYMGRGSHERSPARTLIGARR